MLKQHRVAGSKERTETQAGRGQVHRGKGTESCVQDRRAVSMDVYVPACGRFVVMRVVEFKACSPASLSAPVALACSSLICKNSMMRGAAFRPIQLRGFHFPRF